MSGTNVYFNGKWKSQTFTADGTFTVPDKVTLIAIELFGAGGGGGFSGTGGFGGEAGEYVTAFKSVTPGQNISVNIGLGGAGAAVDKGDRGGDSSFGDLLAKGGKGGSPDSDQSFVFSPVLSSAVNYEAEKGFGIGRPGIYGNGGTSPAISAGNAYPGDGGYGNGGSAGRFNPTIAPGNGGVAAGGGGAVTAGPGGDGGDGICIVYWKED